MKFLSVLALAFSLSLTAQLNAAAGPLFHLQQGLTALKSKLAQLGEALDNLANPMIKAEDLITNRSFAGINYNKLTLKTLQNFQTKLTEVQQIINTKDYDSTNPVWTKIITLWANEEGIKSSKIIKNLKGAQDWYSDNDILLNLNLALNETNTELTKRATPPTATGSSGATTGGTTGTGSGAATGTGSGSGGGGGSTTTSVSNLTLHERGLLEAKFRQRVKLEDISRYLDSFTDQTLQGIKDLHVLGNLQTNLIRLNTKNPSNIQITDYLTKVQTRMYNYLSTQNLKSTDLKTLESLKTHLETLQESTLIPTLQPGIQTLLTTIETKIYKNLSKQNLDTTSLTTLQTLKIHLEKLKNSRLIPTLQPSIQTLLTTIETKITAASVSTGRTIQTSKDTIDNLCTTINSNVAFSSTNLDGGPHSFFVKNKNKIYSLQEIANKQATDGSDLSTVFNYFVQQVKTLNLTKAQLENIFGHAPQEIKEGLGMVASADDVKAAQEKEELGKLRRTIKGLNDFFAKPIKLKMEQGKDLAGFEKGKLKNPYLNDCDTSINYFETNQPVHNASDVTPEMARLKTLLESIKTYLKSKETIPALQTTCEDFITQIDPLINKLP